MRKKDVWLSPIYNITLQNGEETGSSRKFSTGRETMNVHLIVSAAKQQFETEWMNIIIYTYSLAP